MFKRPPQRVRYPPATRVGKPEPGTFLYDIINTTETKCYRYERAPIYKKEDYLKMLKKNNTELGIPYVEPDLPDAPECSPPETPNEPKLEYGDRVGVSLKILKSGIVRVKVSAAIATMYDKYYSRGVQPPFKTVLQAYKSHGFSPQFLERIKKSHEKKMVFAKKVPKIFEKIFEKEPVKKIKKKREEEKKEVPDDEPEQELEEDDIPDEEGELDVEPDEEDIVEEEYFSEPDA